jgi:hypothetical protein
MQSYLNIESPNQLRPLELETILDKLSNKSLWAFIAFENKKL